MSRAVTDEPGFRVPERAPEQILAAMDEAELRAHLRALHAVTEAVLAHLTLPELLRELLARLRTVLAVDTATVLLCTEDGRTLQVRASKGLEEEVEERIEIPLGQGIAGAVAARRRAVIVDDVSRIRTVSPLVRRLASMMVAPLGVGDDLLGVLHVGTLEPRVFAERELYLLQVAADRVALAIRNALTFDRERAEAERRARVEVERRRSGDGQRFLSDASAVLARSLAVDETLRQLTGMIVERLADGCAIDLASPNGSLERVAVASRDPEKVRIVRELEERYPTPLDSPAGHTTAFRTGEPQLFTAFPDELLRSASRDEEHFRLWKTLGMEAVLNAPLIARGRTMGVITLVQHTPGRTFDDLDLDLVVDLSHRAALAIDNARLYTEAEAASRAKTDFLAAMSHELRTPLNAIAGYVDLIDAGIHGPVTEAQRHALERVRRSQEHLLTLINDVLHFAHLDAGRMEFDLQDVPVAEALDAIAPVVEPQAQARGIAFAVEPADPVHAVRADPERLRQVLMNLLGNALKFTPGGGWVAMRVDADDERVRIRVQDSGRGIPRDHLEAVFDPFVQLERHRNESSRQGLGLGLAVGRDLARGMGGELAAESEEGVGSTFTLTLPRAGTSYPGG
jgi:signal transduction histidine kinase/putative methionine-R-sulfoxide reductase with GAF domain